MIDREPVGVTAKLYAVGSQLSGNMQNFWIIKEFFLSAENRVGSFNEGAFLISVRQKALKEINTLLKAILKFSTTNQLLKVLPFCVGSYSFMTLLNSRSLH